MPRPRRTIDTTREDHQRALKLIRARCGEFDFGVETIAADLACSRRQVQRIFETNGTTVRSELFVARMERGARELAADTPVCRAADLSGYQHARHFTTAFHRYYGLTPSDVRRAAKIAARLRRRTQRMPPPPASPGLAVFVRAWRKDHRMLVKSLRGRCRGTVLDELFADAIALRGPDLRTPDGQATINALRLRFRKIFLSESAPTTPGGARTKSRVQPRMPARRA